MRVLLALGGNAMTGADGRARVEDQQAAAVVAMRAVADLIEAGSDVVVTHGNGPQVGNLLVKNELAAAVVPPVPLDWCGAQTQATLGFTLMNALDNELAARGLRRPSATVVTRTLVAADDPGLTRPTKPIGRFLPEAEARRLIEHGERWEACGEKGWRRMVGSPEPLEVLDGPAVRALVDAGYVVVANGGGGIPTVSEGGVLRGVEAVIDKDLRAALRHSGGRAARRGRGEPDAAAPRRGPLLLGFHGTEGRGRVPVRRPGRPVRRHHRALPDPRRRRGLGRHRRRTRLKPTERKPPCPAPSRSARSPSTRSPTPASWRR
jgi:carbamate kinase